MGNLITEKVARGILSLQIVERGWVTAGRTIDIVCSLRSREKGSSFATTVKWLIDPGVAVKKGDKLIELDDSALQVELNERTFDVKQAQTAQDKATENLTRVQTDTKIDTRLAEIMLQLAEVRLKRDKGEDRDRKEELQLKVEQAGLGLQRVKAQARAKAADAQAESEAKAAVLELAIKRKNEVVADLSKCVLRAPQDGVVFYYVPEQTRGGPRQSVVAQGEPVREGQKLLEIHDLSQFQVNVRVHEAAVSLLRDANPLAKNSWQHARIRVDAFPSSVLEGHVKTVDNVAAELDFFAADVKFYKTIVAVDKPIKGLKPGMSAEVAITAQQSSGPVLKLPVLAVMTEGKKQFCFVVTDKEVQEREIVTGLSNGYVEVRSGLKEGVLVVSSARALVRRLAAWLDAGGKSAAAGVPMGNSGAEPQSWSAVSIRRTTARRGTGSIPMV